MRAERYEIGAADAVEHALKLRQLLAGFVDGVDQEVA
jgi:hypothetical protein